MVQVASKDSPACRLVSGPALEGWKSWHRIPWKAAPEAMGRDSPENIMLEIDQAEKNTVNPMFKPF